MHMVRTAYMLACICYVVAPYGIYNVASEKAYSI